MFKLFQTQNVSTQNQAAPDTENAAPNDDALNMNSLKQALSDIAEGKYQTHHKINPEIDGILDELAQKISGQQERQLSRSVDLSMRINEAVIAGAEMSRTGGEILERSNGMAAAVEELTASIQQISTSTDQVAKQAQSLRDISKGGMQLSQAAASEMHEVSASVSQTETKLESLKNAAQEITDVVSFISDIADQTNLLALNATIEAARAGEAGKGFAVVANEVKALANKTSENAEQIIAKVEALKNEISDINGNINAVVKAVEKGEQSITSTNEQMQNILSVSQSITEQSHNVSDILTEQKTASNDVSEGVTMVAKMADLNMQKINTTLDAMDGAEKTLIDQLQSFVGKEIDSLTVNLAKSDHVIWKKRLANMMVGRESLNAGELADHHSCRLGKWYDALNDERFKSQPAYSALLDPHKKVHFHGIEAAKKYNCGDLEGALKEIQHVETASQDVIRYLDELIKGLKK